LCVLCYCAGCCLCVLVAMWHVGTHRRQSKAFGIKNVFSAFRRHRFQISSTGRSLARSASYHVKRGSRAHEPRSSISRAIPTATTDGSTRGPQTAALHPQRRAADRTETALTRRRAPRSPPQCRAILSVVPRPRRRAHCCAPPVTRRMQRGLSWSRCSRSRALPTSRSRPTPVLVPALRPSSAACVHGAPSRVSTQRSTPDAGANARIQPAL